MADYFANNAAYVKNCENKARPKMHCNGQCQMMKKILTEEKKDKENSDRKNENRNEVSLSSKSFFTTIIYSPFKYKKVRPIAHYTSVLSLGKSIEIFHPPQAA